MNVVQKVASADQGALVPDIDFSPYRRRFSTDRYRSPEYLERERDRLWMRVWQIAGRADEIPEPGDWKTYKIYDQSYILVRGKDGVVRGFVNSCRHRGNRLCNGEGSSPRFTCPYHNWSYALDGRLMAVAKPDFEGPVEDFVGSKDELGLLPIKVECFAGFIFMNPDADAMPLADFLGPAAPQLAAYKLDEMIPCEMNVRETIASNWKVVMDAFYEGYHVQGVHPELVPFVDLTNERFADFGNHSATMVPFGAGAKDCTPDEEVEAIASLPPANFPGLADALPRFAELAAELRGPDGKVHFPEGMTGRTLLQRATREAMTAKGLDVSGLNDSQMSDYQFWALFPNVYMQVRAGEATVIKANPHPDGDPHRCMWHVYHLLWFPEGERAQHRAEPVTIPEGEHYPYFLALEQDFQTMEGQQLGLRNEALPYMVLTKQEPKLALFHTTLDQWMEGCA